LSQARGNRTKGPRARSADPRARHYPEGGPRAQRPGNCRQRAVRRPPSRYHALVRFWGKWTIPEAGTGHRDGSRTESNRFQSVPHL